MRSPGYLPRCTVRPCLYRLRPCGGFSPTAGNPAEWADAAGQAVSGRAVGILDNVQDPGRYLRELGDPADPYQRILDDLLRVIGCLRTHGRFGRFLAAV